VSRKSGASLHILDNFVVGAEFIEIKRDCMNKPLNLRSLLLGVLLGGVVIASIGAAVNRRSEWEYRILGGYTQPSSSPKAGNHLPPLLEAAGSEGWEAVSWTQDESNPPYFRVLLKRLKE
jgi:hypothetical protein